MHTVPQLIGAKEKSETQKKWDVSEARVFRERPGEAGGVKPAGSKRRRSQAARAGWDQGGPSWTCCPPLSAGHPAADEVPGGGALLHEHQPGAGELQQVCPQQRPRRSPAPPAPFLASALFPGAEATRLCFSACSRDGCHDLMSFLHEPRAIRPRGLPLRRHGQLVFLS